MVTLSNIFSFLFFFLLFVQFYGNGNAELGHMSMQSKHASLGYNMRGFVRATWGVFSPVARGYVRAES